MSDDDYRRELLAEFIEPPTIAWAIAVVAHVQEERFDRSVCRVTRNGVAIPATSAERALCFDNARASTAWMKRQSEQYGVDWHAVRVESKRLEELPYGRIERDFEHARAMLGPRDIDDADACALVAHHVRAR